jgi:DNA-binding CsgD family transcriptional regulator
MRIGDFIEASNQAETPEQVFAVLQDAVAKMGFDRIMYRALRNHRDTALPCTARTYPDEWIAHYVERKYTETDPVGHRCLASSQPFLWAELLNEKKRDESRIFHEAEDVGLKDGVAVPIHGPAGECVGVGFASSSGGAETRLLPQLHLMAVQFHTAYSALATPRAISTVRLTPREREILTWSAQGKSAWATGQILSIAEHSVEWHLQNIYRKLGVDSRITAVVKALHLGLISH